MDARAQLQSALALHQSGRLDDAELIYRQILARAPEQADALHFLGLAAHQRGRHEEALTLMDRALRAAPAYAACHSNRGNALLALGRLDEAVAAFRQALALQRDFADAHLNLGNALLRQGHAEDAIASYRRALRTAPNSPEIHYNVGRAYAAGGRLAEAARSYGRAVALRPDYLDALFNLGTVHQAAGDTAEAISAFQRVIALRPEHAAAHNNLGAALQHAGREEEALASYRRALALQPGFPEAHNNLGNVLLAAGDTAGAIASYEAAVAARPDYAAAHNNLGNALQAAGRLDEAIARHDRALALQPDFPDAAWNKAFALLLKGDYAAGWPLFEARWQLPGQRQDPDLWSRPCWRGDEPLAGRTVLLHHEQGFGDTLQMLRYAPLLAARGARVLVRVPAPLARITATVEGVAGVLGPEDPLPDFDLHCPMMSLPRAFGTTLATVPAAVPYLRPQDPAAWAARLGPRPPLRVGLAWSGSATHRNDRLRSVPLAALAPLLALPAAFHSLQTEYRPGDAGLRAAHPQLRDHAGSLGDFADTAGLVSQLDLVIAVDTAAAHLAGALGRPTWLLLPAAPDYRWLLGRTDSPWYPTMRLFRQSPGAGWEPVLATVAAALRELLAP